MIPLWRGRVGGGEVIGARPGAPPAACLPLSPFQDQMRHTTEWEEFLSQVRRTRKPYLDLASGERVKVS